VEKLLGPWTLCEPGFQPLEDWVEMDQKVTEEMGESFGGTVIGAFLEKR